MQYLSAAASLRLKYVCDRDSEMQNLEICMSGKCKKSISFFFFFWGDLRSLAIIQYTSTIRILKAKLGTEKLSDAQSVDVVQGPRVPAVIKAAMAAKAFAKTLSRIFQNKKWKQRCRFISWKFIFDTNLSIRTYRIKE